MWGGCGGGGGGGWGGVFFFNDTATTEIYTLSLHDALPICVIGRNCAIAAQVGLAGGVELGDGVVLAGQVGIANRLKLAKGTIVSSKSGVTRSASKPGQVLSGFPAVSNKEWLKTSAIIRRLPEMYQTLKQIRKHLNL